MSNDRLQEPDAQSCGSKLLYNQRGVSYRSKIYLVTTLIHWRDISISHVDHNALKWIHTCSDQNRRLRRWSLRLSEFNDEVLYRPGTVRQIPDSVPVLPMPVDTQGCEPINDVVPTFEQSSDVLVQRLMEQGVLGTFSMNNFLCHQRAYTASHFHPYSWWWQSERYFLPKWLDNQNQQPRGTRWFVSFSIYIAIVERAELWSVLSTHSDH